MKKINFILLIISIITLLVSVILYVCLDNDILRYLIIGSFISVVYWSGWLLGHSCGLIEQKAKNKPILYLPLDKPNEHDEIAQIVEAQRIYANSKDKKVCKKCVNCKHCVNDNYCDLFDGRILKKNRFTSCKHFRKF